jgi:dolichol-phosphate mannosyltransferase
MADFRLVDRMVADELKAMCDGQLFLRGLIAWMGYRRAVLPFAAQPRHSGQTQYTVRKMLALAKAGMLSLSPAPPRIATWSGLTAGAAGLAMLLRALGAALPPPGNGAAAWAAAGGAALMFALVLLLIGVQGEYLLRIHDRVRRRPPYLIERVIRRDSASDGGSSRPPAPSQGGAPPTP